MKYNDLRINLKLSNNIPKALKQELFDFIPKIRRHDPDLHSWREFFKEKKIPFIVTKHHTDKNFMILWKKIEKRKREDI